jgi:hypothetical protein
MIGALLASAIFIQAQPSGSPETSRSSPAAAPANTVSSLTVTRERDKRRDLDPNEVLCQEESAPGTRFPTTVCATRAEFAERTRQHRDLLRDRPRPPAQ